MVSSVCGSIVLVRLLSLSIDFWSAWVDATSGLLFPIDEVWSGSWPWGWCTRNEEDDI
jgi:hypothetical protein